MSTVIQKEIDRSLPIGRVFQGSGEQDQHDKEARFYQHGLYFGADGKLLANNPHNAKKLAQLRALEPDEADPDVENAPLLNAVREPVNPRIAEAFNGKSDEEVLGAAERIVDFNKENGVVDDYVPTLEARGDNLRFIAKHAG